MGYVRHKIKKFLFEVGPFCKGYPHSKNRLRVPRVLTKEPVVKETAVSGPKSPNQGINCSLALSH